MKPYYLYTDINSGLRWHLVLANENSINFVESNFVEPMSIEEYTSAIVGSVAVEIPSAEELLCMSKSAKRRIEMLTMFGKSVLTSGKYNG